MNAHSWFDNNKRYRSDSHHRQAMLTPSYVLEPVRSILGEIDLDPCTEPDNPTKANKFYHLPDDGAGMPWNASTIFCNPPYGKARERWVKRCIEASKDGAKVVLLIPAATETRSFQQALKAAQTILLIQGRLRFGVLRKNGIEEAASHGTALFGFNVDLTAMSNLGTVITSKIQT